MNVFFDLIIVFVVIAFLISGLKKGFFKSITDLIIIVLSVLLPYFFAPVLAEYYYNNFVYNDLVNKINDILSQNMGLANSARNILGLIYNLPSFFKNDFTIYNVTANDIFKALSGSGDKSLIIADLLKPSILKTLTIIMFAILLIITFIALKLLFKVLFKMPKFPAFGLIDSVLGLCMGALKCAIFIFISVVIFRALLLIIPQNGFLKDVNSAIDNSQIFKSVYNLNIDVLNNYLKLG